MAGVLGSGGGKCRQLYLNNKKKKKKKKGVNSHEHPPLFPEANYLFKKGPLPSSSGLVTIKLGGVHGFGNKSQSEMDKVKGTDCPVFTGDVNLF